jgi:hypothetical protein
MKNSDKIILDLCGGTGAWSKPYADAGYDVRVITLPDGDVRNYDPPVGTYGILAAPPCTMFSYARTKAKEPRDLRGAIHIVWNCLRIIWEAQYETETSYTKTTRLKFWALENPNGMLKYFLGKPVFEFSPYDFGDQYKKRTHLWGWFNDPQKATSPETKKQMPKFDHMKTKDIHPEYYGKLTRQERRAITPQGFAKAFFKANK